ncbi:hypothetical protein [Streptomyces bambusae]|uniref:Uncharacterized protein n=1 Tax=Streptomyces bambusae TaxID=1550616 RepID=A0ABS6Z1B4_9ACTN|nr:hypothetical protein [Streptomyces bambusae]MBW5481038.1 hypothetical protein [Streptomyces bambusae]
MSSTTIERRELGRFLAIAGRRFENGKAPAEMLSPAVDAAWHQMLDTPEYEAFSTEHAGTVLGHSEMNGAGPIAWVADYEEAYGPLPEVWFTDAKGNVDDAAVVRYKETGTVVAEWDCGPTTGDGDDAAPATR